MWRKGVFRRFASLPTRKNSHGSEEKQGSVSLFLLFTRKRRERRRGFHEQTPFFEGMTKGPAARGSSSIFGANQAVASRAWKGQFLWKKKQHSPMTSRRMGWNSDASLWSATTLARWRSIAMCWERQ